MPLGWEVIYLDGTRFSSKDGGPEWAPRTKVHAILQDDPIHGCRILKSSDGRWYWRYDRWWPSDIDGITLYLATSIGDTAIVLFGEWIPDEALAEIEREAKSRKANWLSSFPPHERRII